MADIDNNLEQIRTAIYGKDVRESIASGIEAINIEVENTTEKQEDLESTFDQLIINSGSSNAEIVDARVNTKTNTTYLKLKDRLDSEHEDLSNKMGILNDLQTTEKGNLVGAINENVTQLNDMVRKDGNGQVTWANIAQDVRENISGGNVAVVGANAVLDINLTNGSVTPYKTTFFKAPTNLFNRKTAIVNSSINHGDGVISAYTNWNVSDFVPVKPNTKYIRSADTNLVFYDASKNRISGLANGAGNITFTTPGNAYYIRFNVWASDILTSTFMLVEGESLPSTFVEHQFTLDPKFPLILPKETKELSITCWGDSLTEGYGGGGTTYPSVLATLTGKTVNNMGISGESTTDIIARQGGYHAIVNPFTIPSDTTSVEITYKQEGVGLGGVSPKTQLGIKGTKGINPVTINGIQGNISYTNSKFYFTRLTAGTATEITRPTPIYANSAVLYKDDIQVIFMGTNGGWIKTGATQDYNIKSLISQINMMIDYNTSKKYIIIGMHYFYDWVLANGIVKTDLEYALVNQYGRHYINLRDYMINWGLQDAGLTATQADTDAIAAGNVPPSLLYSDNLHGNAQFYTILGNLVYKRGQELGYW